MSLLRSLLIVSPLLVQMSDCTAGGCEADADPTPAPQPTPEPDTPTCDVTFGAFEVCDGIDNDCNGTIDDFCTPFDETAIVFATEDLEDLIDDEIDDDVDFERQFEDGLVGFTPNGSIAFFTDENRAVFISPDGEFLGGNAKPLDLGTTTGDVIEDLDANGFGFASGDDALWAFATGEWETTFDDVGDTRTDEGTVFFQVNQNNGARTGTPVRMRGRHVEWAGFTPDGRLIGYSDTDDFADQILWFDLLGDVPLEISPEERLTQVTIDPSPGGGVWACMDDRIVAFRGDGSFEDEPAGRELECPDFWTVGSDGNFYYLDDDGGDVFGIETVRSKQFDAFILRNGGTRGPDELFGLATATRSRDLWMLMEVEDNGNDEWRLGVISFDGPIR